MFAVTIKIEAGPVGKTRGTVRGRERLRRTVLISRCRRHFRRLKSTLSSQRGGTRSGRAGCSRGYMSWWSPGPINNGGHLPETEQIDDGKRRTSGSYAFCIRNNPWSLVEWPATYKTVFFSCPHKLEKILGARWLKLGLSLSARGNTVRNNS